MQPEKILAFSDFLAREPKSYNEIAQFLVMSTFSTEKFANIFIGELIETGVVCPLAGFGWRTDEYAAFKDHPIHEKLPVTDAIRENTIIIGQNDAAFKSKYPLMSEYPWMPAWKSVISIPVYPIGGMVMFSLVKIELTDELKVFYVAIGSLLGLYASRLPAALAEVAINVKQKIDLPQIPLTGRQLVITDLLERGFNNAQIGLELGYSESLIRQETVVIYRKLQVTGRKALQAIRTLNLENEELSE